MTSEREREKREEGNKKRETRERTKNRPIPSGRVRNSRRTSKAKQCNSSTKSRGLANSANVRDLVTNLNYSVGELLSITCSLIGCFCVLRYARLFLAVCFFLGSSPWLQLSKFFSYFSMPEALSWALGMDIGLSITVGLLQNIPTRPRRPANLPVPACLPCLPTWFAWLLSQLIIFPHVSAYVVLLRSREARSKPIKCHKGTMWNKRILGLKHLKYMLS